LEEDDEVIYRELIKLLPDILCTLKRDGQTYTYVKQKLPPTNIAFLLFKDVLQWYSLEDTRQMRYSSEVTQFWSVCVCVRVRVCVCARARVCVCIYVRVFIYIRQMTIQYAVKRLYRMILTCQVTIQSGRSCPPLPIAFPSRSFNLSVSAHCEGILWDIIYQHIAHLGLCY
jgi:hypothetical protein